MPRSAFKSQERQAELARYGFSVVDLLNPSEMESLRGLWRDLGAAPDDPKGAIHFGFFSDDPEWKRSVTRKVKEIIGSALERHFDDQVVYFTMFVIKWPGDKGAFGPHQDPSFVDEEFHRTVTVWCPLEPTGPENGQLHLVPGSHTLGPDVRVNDTSRFAHRSSERLILGGLGVAVPTQPGQCVVFDNRTVHYSQPNRTTGPRAVLAVGLRPSEARCFHFEVARDASQMVDVVPIDHDYFIDLNPLRIQVQGLSAPVERRVPMPAPIEPEHFIAAVEHAGVPPYATSAVSTTDWDVQYCFVCSSTERLLTDPTAERGGMAVCEDCLQGVIERYTAPPAVEEGPPSAAPPAVEERSPSTTPRPSGGVRGWLRRGRRYQRG